MFRQPNFSNLRFNIIQAVNPYIQQPSNKFVETTVQSVSKTMKNSAKRTAQKVLNKDIKLASPPNSDTVTLSTRLKNNKVKTLKNNDKSYGKTIKNVLSKYFDNEDINIDKQTNLNMLVAEYCQERYHKFKAPRIRAIKSMSNAAIAKYKVMQQSIIDEENENRRIYNLYLNQFQDWCDF